MSGQFNIDDLEEFIQREADKHRMYPNNQVWQNINEELHGRNRWPALTFTSTLICLFLIFGFIFFNPNKELNNTPRVTIANMDKGSAIKAISTRIKNENRLPLVSVKDKLNGSFQPFQSLAFDKGKKANDYEVVLNTSLNRISSVEKETLKKEQVTTESPIFNNNDAKEQKFNLKFNSSEVKNVPPTKTEIAKKDQKQKDKWSFVMYGGPSISYRILSQSDNSDSHIPYNPVLAGSPTQNVNDFVRQHPSYGAQIGMLLQYSINDRLRIKGGLQISYRHYTMDAYNSSNQKAILLLNRSTYFDTIITNSNIRNISDQFSDKSITLSNHYIQIGLPIGLDWTFKSTKKLNLHAGLAFQSTYQINKNIYLISSDYNHYVKTPSLMRRWNFNVETELLAEFKIGKTNWLAGPQIKYQLLPSQVRNYSIQERLIDYGFKIGVVKHLK